LLELIEKHSIFRQLTEAGVHPITFANAYTSRFFSERPRWVSATTAAVEAAGLQFRTVADVRNGAAVFMDYTNRILLERGEDVALRNEAEAATVLARIVAENRFSLYEYFITDKVGHAQDMDLAKTILTSLALFIRELLIRLDLDRTTVILTSDHGNIEDLSSRNHTLHAVPTIVWGAQREQIAARIRTLADITPAIVALLTGK
jgi:2,3-bisphosphoglycerate-independent phosphoglycerate mutase